MPALVFVALLALGAVFSALIYRQGGTLLYGDAEAHFNIARRIIDNRDPGYEQIGTVWLPLPHLLLIPLVRNFEWWVSGSAGAMLGVVCYAVAGAFLFAAARRFFGATEAAITTVGVFALNPNLLYLQSTPMTEPLFFAAAAAILYCTAWFADTQSIWGVIGTGVASLCASWIRYDGWWLIPAVTLFFLIRSREHRWRNALVFGAIASLAPALWLLHNRYIYSNALEFYNGPDSALGIAKRAAKAGVASYPGDHDWRKAAEYFKAAALTTAGAPAFWIGMAGLLCAFARRTFWPVILLALAPLFYIASMYSSGTPIFLPQLYPHGYYNSRYGLACLPLLAIGCGAIAAIVPAKIRGLAAIAILGAAIAPWLLTPHEDAWICWKEAKVNYTPKQNSWRQASEYLRSVYHPGDGVFMQFGDEFAAVIRQAGIPIREVLQPGNSPHWMAAQIRPDLFLWETWAVVQQGDMVSTAMEKAVKDGRYRCVKIVAVPGTPVIEIYHRQQSSQAALP